MKFTNPAGRIFGINPIDFLVIVFLISLLPAFYFGYKIFTRPKVVVEGPQPTHYLISRSCPNCGKGAAIKEIPFGELLPLEWKDVCGRCGNEVEFIKPPKPIKLIPIKDLPEEPDYQQFYYKQLLKEKGWLE